MPKPAKLETPPSANDPGEDWSRLSRPERRKIHANVTAFELKHGCQPRGARPSGAAWKKLADKIEQAAKSARAVEFTPGEIQRIFCAVRGIAAPAEASEQGTGQTSKRTRARKHPRRRQKRAMYLRRRGQRIPTAARRRIVSLHRRGHSIRAAAKQSGVAFECARYWVRRTAGIPLEAINWQDASPGPLIAPNRTDPWIERAVLAVREDLCARSSPKRRVPWGPDAIRAALLDRGSDRYLGEQAPSRRTIARILRRNGRLS